jgi:pimeloyl-ACP methyl ester carboxylesterase
VATPRLDSVRLTAADGGPLRVDVRTGQRPGERRPAVVICHGFKGFKDWGFFPKIAERLAVAGFTAISFNFSGSGVGEGEEFDEIDRWSHQTPSADLEDLRTVTQYAAEHGSGWVGVLGHSRGGGLAILQAARDEQVKALVTWAAIDHFLRWPEDQIARWRKNGRIDVVNSRTGQVLPILRDALDDLDAHGEQLDVVAASARVKAPWLIVHGTSDATVSVAVAHHLVASGESPRTEMFLVDGADHTFGIRHPWAGSTPEFDAVQDRTVRHFASAL